MESDLLLVADHTLTPDERKLFLDRFTAVNRHYRGAHVADVLEVLYDTDAYCGHVEQFLEEHPEVPGPVGALALLCAILLYNGPGEPTDAQALALADRITKAAARD
jgi:hypothetical protein